MCWRLLIASMLLASVPPVRAHHVIPFVGAKTNEAVEGLQGATEVVVSPDGAHVYVASYDGKAVMAFLRNAETGALEFVDVETIPNFQGFGGVVVVSPDGAHVLATDGGGLLVFERNTGTGALTFLVRHDVGTIASLAGARGVAFSPNGAHVYVAGQTAKAVTVFSRAMPGGALTFVQAVLESSPDVDGLDYASDVKVSPDGSHVYVASQAEDAVAWFARNPTTGELAVPNGKVRHGVDCVVGLEVPSTLVISPDGDHVYVRAKDSNALTAFARNAGTGDLAFMATYPDNAGGVNGLQGSGYAAISSDGRRLYVTSNAENAVGVFARDTFTGLLSFLGFETNGSGGVSGIQGAEGVTVSPDGDHVYVGGYSSAAVGIFRALRCGNGEATLDEECDDGNLNDTDTCRNDCTSDGTAASTTTTPSGPGVCSSTTIVTTTTTTSSSSTTSTILPCGNGALDPGEDCDLGPLNGLPEGQGSCCDAVCAFRPFDFECGAPPSTSCLIRARCSGGDDACPQPTPAPSDQSCVVPNTPCSVEDHCDAGACVEGRSTCSVRAETEPVGRTGKRRVVVACDGEGRGGRRAKCASEGRVRIEAVAENRLAGGGRTDAERIAQACTPTDAAEYVYCRVAKHKLKERAIAYHCKPTTCGKAIARAIRKRGGATLLLRILTDFENVTTDQDSETARLQTLLDLVIGGT